MDMDFIKWMCERAEGFRHVEKMHDIECPDQMYIGEYLIVKNKARYPLLLQRAIEGLNMISDIWIQILISPDTGGSIAWKPFMNCKYQLNGDLYLWPDQAKEAALKYIYEQENRPINKKVVK